MANKPIYTVRRSDKAKRLRLAVYCDGSVVLTAPAWVKNRIIEKFISDKKKWVVNKVEYFKNIGSRPIRRYPRGDYKKYKEAARVLVRAKIEHFNQIFGYTYNRVSIKNQKTRWGSCSVKKNLNFNYKIVYLPEKEQDYLVVHELCHLKELNHSRRFWQLVEKALPDYKAVRHGLKNRDLF